MIHGKSGALALLGIFFWTVVASAADSGLPLAFNSETMAGNGRLGDMVYCSTPSPATNEESATADGGTDTEPLQRSSWLSDLVNNCAPCGCYWTASADILLLHRSASGSQPLLFDPLSQTYLVNSSDMAFPWAAGPRASVIAHNLYGFDLEASFFAIDSWTASADFPTSSLPAGFAFLSVDSVFQGMGGIPVTDARFTERSQLYNGELNLRQQINNSVTLLAGFRWVELYDSYQAQGNTFSDGAFTHSVRAFNHMYGFQLGTDVALFQQNSGYSQFGQTTVIQDQPSRFRINGILKAGIFANTASQESEYSNPSGLGDFTAQAAGKHPTFLGEAGVVATYQLGTHVALHGGYQVMYVDGVALASRQISSTDLITTQFATIETAGSVLYHGANAGLEFTW